VLAKVSVHITFSGYRPAVAELDSLGILRHAPHFTSARSWPEGWRDFVRGFFGLVVCDLFHLSHI